MLRAAGALCGSVAMLIGAGSAAAAGGFDFQFDIAPILARYGCAAADCHGGATGRGGFKLSLFASESEGDYWALTGDLQGRRIDRRDPGNSLLLLKPTRQVKHGGGKVLEVDGESYRRLREWIEAGAPYHASEPRTLQSLAFSDDRILASFRHRDGSEERRDVTSMARFSSTNAEVAAVDEEGEVELRGPGKAWIIAAYAGLAARKPVFIPFSDKPTAPLETMASENPLDQAWLKGLQSLGLAPDSPAEPRQLVRRLYLDLAGRIPSTLELRDYLEDDQDMRTAKLAKKLVESPEFEEAWAPLLYDWFQVAPPQDEAAASRDRDTRLRAALKSWLGSRRPLTDLAGEVVEMDGDGFLTRFEDPRDRAEFVGRTLLGISIECARCHNHPQDRWRQSQHLQFSALFSDPRPDPDRPGAMMAGALFLPGENRAVSPALLPLGSEPGLPVHEDGTSTETLKKFVLESAAEPFARNVANRVFGKLTGKHLVEAPDDHRLTNPPLNTALLDVLVDELQASGFDLRSLVQQIVTSNVYQLGSVRAFVDGDPAYRYLARREARSLTDEQWRRSVEQALDLPIPRGTQAVSPLTRQLALLNGTLLHEALNTPGNQVEAVFDFEPDPAKQLEALCQLILSRPPEPAEVDVFLPVLRDAEDPLRAGKGLSHAWFLSREFGSHR